jgi:Flp pilus assembly protein TadG
MKRRKQNDRNGDSGQSLVETSLMLVVIFMVAFWIVEMCGVVYTYATIANAAEEGARYGITSSGVVAGDSRIVTRVKNFAATSLHNVSAISVAVTLPDGSSTPPNRVKVTVSYTYVPWLNSVMKNPLVMNAYAEGRMVVQ